MYSSKSGAGSFRRSGQPFRFSPLPLLIALAFALPAGTVLAAEELAPAAEPTPYMDFLVSHYLTDDDRQVNDGQGVQVGLGLPLSEAWWLELHGSSAVFDRQEAGITDFYHYTAGGDLQYAFGDRDELTPYVLAGVGGSYNDVVPSVDDNFDYFGNLGVGLTHSLFDFSNVRWRVEARAVYDNFGDGLLDYRLSAGLEFALQKKRPPEVREVIKEVQVVKEVEVIKEVQVVQQVEAPRENADLDGDGIINEADKCPDTPKGAKVDATGCVIEQTLTMRDVTFETGSARLTANGRRILDTVTAFFKSEPSVNAVVEGHTDSRGSDAYNQKLSQARAAAVRDYLVERGIDAVRLEAAGFGESRPVASNDTDNGRELNRRVEFVIRKAQ